MVSLRAPAECRLSLTQVEIARARLVATLLLFHHQALQPLADRLVKEERERVSIAHGVARGAHEGVVDCNRLFEDLQAFGKRGIEQRDPVFIENVKDEGLQRQLLGHRLDPMFAPPAGRFLEGQEFFRGGVVGQGLSVQDGALRLDLLERSRR